MSLKLPNDADTGIPSAYEYAAALEFLTATAEKQDGSGARVSAHIVVGANGGSAGKICISDLRLLDEKRLAAAFIVLKTVAYNWENSAEYCIENGSSRIQAIFKKFSMGSPE